MEDFQVFTDINGNKVCVKYSEVFEIISKKPILLFGMDLETIITFRCEYLKRNGDPNITAKSVMKMFEERL